MNAAVADPTDPGRPTEPTDRFDRMPVRPTGRGGTPEFWVAVNGFPGITEPGAVRAETDGWDGISVPDSQSLTGDPYVALALAARATEHLLVATGVTNVTTRHPAVTATAIATLQHESAGRAILGIGRGDSSLAHLGAAPVSVPEFEGYVRTVRTLLTRGRVDFPEQVGSPAAVLELADAPTATELRWLRHSPAAPVPIEVMASGPRVIRAGAVIADRLTLAVGSAPERLQWAIELARAARRAAGLDPDTLVLGAMIPIHADADRSVARAAMAGAAPGYLRFSVLHGAVPGPVSDADRASLERLRRGYDMTKHGRLGTQGGLVDDSLLDAFTVAGTPAECAARLAEIAGLGIDVFHLQGAFFMPETGPSQRSWQCLAAEVLPAVRAAVGTVTATATGR